MKREFRFECTEDGSYIRVSECERPNEVKLHIHYGGDNMSIVISRDSAKELATVLDGRYSSYGESIRYQSDPDVLDKVFDNSSTMPDDDEPL